MKSILIIAIAILIAGVSITSISAQSQYDIPSWVKNNAVWWGEGTISDSDFISALQFLINNGNLKVNDSSKELNELKSENLELKNKIQVLEIEEKRLRTTIDNINAKPVVVEEEINPSQLSVAELKQQSVEWEYKDILRNEDYYKGKIIYVTGTIDFVIEREDYGNWVLLEVQTEKFGYWETIFYVWHDGSRILKDDAIGAYVVIDGIEKRETMMEGSYILNPIGTSMHLTCTNC